MSGGVERVRDWCDSADLPWQDDGGGLLVRLDPDDVADVRVDPADDDVPLRIHDTVALIGGELPEGRLADVIEDVVLGRSSLVDARPTDDGQGAEVVLVIHAEGLNRHTFLEAVFEIQKVRLLLHREVAAAIAAERTVATLAAMADQAWASQPAPASA